MNRVLECTEDYANIFLTMLGLEIKNYYWEREPTADTTDKQGFFHKADQLKKIFEQLNDVNHPFLKWVFRQPTYPRAIKRFLKKKIYRVSKIENQKNPFVMEVKTVLHGIIALSFLRYQSVEIFGSRFFVKNVKQKKMIMHHSEMLLKLLSENEITATKVSDIFLKQLCALSQGVVEQDVTLADQKYLINIDHPKAAREIFIKEFAVLYSENFSKDGIEPLGKAHADVVFEVVQFVDPDIDKRVVDEHLSRFSRAKVQPKNVSIPTHDIQIKKQVILPHDTQIKKKDYSAS